MNDTKDNKRLKLIEILLIVGGIIGGFGFQNENPLIKKVIFPVFLISSLMYYLQVSNKEHARGELYSLVTSILFSGLITYPMLSGVPTSLWGQQNDRILSYFLGIGLSVVVFMNLKLKSDQEKSREFLDYLVVAFLMFLVLLALGSIPMSK
jgi:uncharacterized membrane protein YfcA